MDQWEEIIHPKSEITKAPRQSYHRFLAVNEWTEQLLTGVLYQKNSNVTASPAIISLCVPILGIFENILLKNIGSFQLGAWKQANITGNVFKVRPTIAQL